MAAFKLPWPLLILGGKLGINQSSPTEVLDVGGNIKASGLILPDGTLTKVLRDSNSGSDLWNNAALGAGYNGLPSPLNTTTINVDTNASLVVAIQASAVIILANNAFAGWAVYIDGALAANFGRVYDVAGATIAVPGGVYVFPWGTAGAPTAGSHTIEPRFYISAGQNNGTYLRCASFPNQEFARFTVLEMRQ